VPTIPTAMGKVVAVCGMPGSGKGEFAQIIAKQGIPVRSMGDMVRAEVASRNLEPSPTIFGEVAADLRANHGEEVLAVRLADEVDNLLETHPVVLIEGMRGTAEFEIFKNRWKSNFSSMAIEASKEIRFARTQSRGRSEDGDYTQFEIRETREAGWGLTQLISKADFTIINEGNLEELIYESKSWLSNFS
jgi:dephospho-CoA kinase